jgi:hypothetical protein
MSIEQMHMLESQPHKNIHQSLFIVFLFRDEHNINSCGISEDGESIWFNFFIFLNCFNMIMLKINFKK